MLFELVTPPALERYCHVTPLPGVTPIKALAAFTFVLARIITPAFDHGSMFCNEKTRATMVQAPVTGT